MSARLPLFTILLCAANASLLTAVVWQLLTGSQRDGLAASDDASEAPPVFESLQLPSAPSFDSIQAQAIFHKSRSFYVAPPPQIVVQPPPDYRLAGSMSIPGQKSSAVLVHAQTGARVKVAVGDQLDGWTVTDVASGRVAIQQGERLWQITSATGKQSSGMTMTSSAQMTAPAAGMVRILGQPGESARAAAPRKGAWRESPRDNALRDSPRLYRPPVSQ